MKNIVLTRVPGWAWPGVIAAILNAAAAHAPASTALPSVPGATLGVTAFVNVNIVPMDYERVLPDHAVLVQGSEIIALGPSHQVAIPAGAARIDGTGKFLIPGLGDE